MTPKPKPDLASPKTSKVMAEVPTAKKASKKLSGKTSSNVSSQGPKASSKLSSTSSKGGKKKSKRERRKKKKEDTNKRKKKKNTNQIGGVKNPMPGYFGEFMARTGLGYGRMHLTDPATLQSIEKLGMTQFHIRMLNYRFNLIDVDASGVISSEEFFESIHETKSPFTDALFAVMDMDPNDEIDFEEYIRICATFCLYTREDILRFCFETYDHDGSGAIDEDEFMELCATVNNAAPAFPGNFSTALEQFDVNEDGLIDFNEFCEIDRRFPLVLFPAFRLQDGMQKYTLGEAEWLKLIQRASGKGYSSGCLG